MLQLGGASARCPPCGSTDFVDEDQPTFTPERTLAVDPTPWFVSYQ